MHPYIGEEAVVIGACTALKKGAVISLTKSMGVEYAQKKVRINCIAPVAIRTEMVKESNLKDPDFNEEKFLKTIPSRRWG